MSKMILKVQNSQFPVTVTHILTLAILANLNFLECCRSRFDMLHGMNLFPNSSIFTLSPSYSFTFLLIHFIHSTNTVLIEKPVCTKYSLATGSISVEKIKSLPFWRLGNSLVGSQALGSDFPGDSLALPV